MDRLYPPPNSSGRGTPRFPIRMLPGAVSPSELAFTYQKVSFNQS